VSQEAEPALADGVWVLVVILPVDCAVGGASGDTEKGVDCGSKRIAVVDPKRLVAVF